MNKISRSCFIGWNRSDGQFPDFKRHIINNHQFNSKESLNFNLIQIEPLLLVF